MADDECGMSTGGTGANFASEMSLNVVSGTPYYIQWDDRWGGQGFTWRIAECYGSVTGDTYRDQNSNGVFDAGEIAQSVMLDLTPGGTSAFSPGMGYALCTDSGTFSLTPSNPPAYHQVVPPSRTITISGQGQLVDSMDFAFQPIPGIYDGSIDLWGWWAWIGNQTQMYLTYCNEGTELLDGSVQLALDPDMNFVSSAPPPTTSTGNGATWGFTGLMPGACVTIIIQVLTDSTVVMGDTLSSTAGMQVNQLDMHLSDNLDLQAVPALTSYDPNDKSVDRSTLSPAEVNAGKALAYTVRFQNTGSLPAVNIIIRDTLDGDLDLGTFEMIGASHPYTLSVVNGVATWSFLGIMLPDSASDEPGSHGAIQYRVSPRTNLMLGDEITNRADIYFDFNPPVLTNTVVTIVNEALTATGPVHPGTLRVHPSPTDGIAYMELPADGWSNAHVEVFDALGRNVRDLGTSVGTGMIRLDLGDLPQGLYTIRARAAQGTVVGRVILRR
jgi:uncharacterized repeat protein (TIGR01451 family)